MTLRADIEEFRKNNILSYLHNIMLSLVMLCYLVTKIVTSFTAQNKENASISLTTCRKSGILQPTSDHLNFLFCRSYKREISSSELRLSFAKSLVEIKENLQLDNSKQHHFQMNRNRVSPIRSITQQTLFRWKIRNLFSRREFSFHKTERVLSYLISIITIVHII